MSYMAADHFKLIIKALRVKADPNMVKAVRKHLVDGYPVKGSANFYEVDPGNARRLIKRIKEVYEAAQKIGKSI